MLAALLAIILIFQTVPGAAVSEDDTPDYGENALRYLYVSDSGSDEHGDGTQDSPWGSLDYAVAKAMPGDTIHLGAGTDDIDSPIELPPGISLEGDGENTILTSSTLT